MLMKIFFDKFYWCEGIFFDHVAFHDSNVSNLMFNTLRTTKILEIKDFLKSYEVCQMYWMVWAYTIIKYTNEKWQWMPKQQ